MREVEERGGRERENEMEREGGREGGGEGEIGRDGERKRKRERERDSTLYPTLLYYFGACILYTEEI